MDRAKESIAPGSKPEDWSSTGSSASPTTSRPSSISVDINGGVVEIDGRLFHDNVQRVPGSSFKDDAHGDSLPHTPAVLTGLLDAWPAFSNPGISWNVQDLASRTTTRVSLDGGPFFARMSMCSGKVTMKEYQRYCENGADGDSAPLYVFDPDILTSSFVDFDANDERSSLLVSDAFSTPACFSNDAMGCINGTEYRPLPPAWLLVGVTRSGTPIHNHPLTVAWNALLVGCKLWCCLPPDVDESLLLLNLDDENDDDFDLSAVDWFQQCSSQLPDTAKIIVQRPGEVVFLPPGWFHVVLNVDDTSTAISVSLTLRRDLESAISLLMKSDKDFAAFWVGRLLKENMYEHIVNKMNLEELNESQELLFDGTEKISVI
jgi:histone arginine demethylase JMJD6